jgi:hypothetical protein
MFCALFHFLFVMACSYAGLIATLSKTLKGRRKRKASKINDGKAKKKQCCPRCFGTNHSRRTFAGCPYNPKNVGTLSTTATVVPESSEKSTAEKENRGKWAGSKIVPM